MAPVVLSERHGEHVLILTINRVERRNAFDGATALALEEALDHYDADRSLRVAVLTGAGDGFCAGQDLIAAESGDWANSRRRGPFGIVESGPSKPIIAAVEGFALAGGLEVALACDLIVAGQAATMGLPEVRWSLIAAAGGLVRLTKRIPYYLAMELALTGESRSATFFHSLGLVNRVVPDGEALKEAIRLAEAISANAPIAVAASAAIVRRAPEWTEAEAWQTQRPYVDEVLASQDSLEGLAAFAERRPPVWKNT